MQQYRDTIAQAKAPFPPLDDRSIGDRLPTTTHHCGRYEPSVLAAAQGHIAVYLAWFRPSQRIRRPRSTFDRGEQARHHLRL